MHVRFSPGQIGPANSFLYGILKVASKSPKVISKKVRTTVKTTTRPNWKPWTVQKGQNAKYNVFGQMVAPPTRRVRFMLYSRTPRDLSLLQG